MDNKVGTDGPTGLPAAQEVDLHKLLRVADFVLRKIVDATDIDPASTKFDFKVDGKTFFAASLATFQKQIRAGIEAPQAAAPGGVAPTPSPDLAELREALERDDDDRTTADWNLIDRWARAALVIIPSHDVWRTALLRIADEHKVYKGHGDYDIVPACSAEDAQSLARTALRNGEPG